MTSRERILAILAGETPDKVGLHETFWLDTLKQWRGNGLGDADPTDVFGYDIALLEVPDTTLRFQEDVVEDTEEYVVKWDANGVLRKDYKGNSGHTPHWMEHKLTCGRHWYEQKECLTFTPDRIPAEAMTQHSVNRQKRLFSAFQCLGPYECAWPIFGQVNMFTMMMDEPEVVRDMLVTFAELEIAAIQEMLSRGIDFDGTYFYEDLGYRNGLLFSPECYDALLFPAHKRLFGFANDVGKPVIMHSCGNIQSMIPKLVEAGISAIQPLEAKCGQDVVELKELYGDKVTLFGNMDVRKLSGTYDDIKDEIMRKLPVAMKGGRYIFHSDHSLPPTVSYDNYCYALELLHEYGNY